VREMGKKRSALAGLEGGFSAHSLRSGFVTEAGTQNVSLADTMALTGHTNVSTVLWATTKARPARGRVSRTCWVTTRPAQPAVPSRQRRLGSPHHGLLGKKARTPRKVAIGRYRTRHNWSEVGSWRTLFAVMRRSADSLIVQAIGRVGNDRSPPASPERHGR